MTWDRQVGGDHYRKVDGEQHWDRVYRLFGPSYFIGCATKYIERYQSKNGKEDLEKAMHFIKKLISLEFPETTPLRGDDGGFNFQVYEAQNTAYMHDETFLCEGGYGDGMNLYTHRATKKQVFARNLRDAAEQWAATQHQPPQSDPV